MIYRKLTILLIFFALKANAQEGKYIQIWGGGQSTQINNSQESYYGGNQDDQVSLEETQRPFFGIDYIYNFHNYFGLQTGLVYSMQGQKYSGFVAHDANDTFFKASDSNVHFTSQVMMTYIKIPFLFRFNSGKDDDNIFDISIYAGFQIAYLSAVEESTSPAPSALLAKPPVNFKKFYNTLDFEWAAGAQVNIFVSQYWGIAIGARYDRSLMDIESKNFVYDRARTYPAEYYYPISTKKASTPAQEDQYTRFSSKNNTVGVYLGVFIPLGGK